MGVENGIPNFLQILDQYKIKADFFVTGVICQKYPEIMNNILDYGHRLGCHGFDHSMENYCRYSYHRQHKDIAKATCAIENIVGFRTIMFRTPNFSVDGNTIKSLEDLDYRIDSSVLPGRTIKKWRVLPIFDFSNAPKQQYHPDLSDVTKKGHSTIIEIPITENPKYLGNPIGMGFLNSCGITETLSIIEKVKSPYVIFLIHPWELVDLGDHYPKLRNWIKESCKGNFEILSEFLKVSNDKFTFSTIEEEVHKGEIQ